jgi:FKBP-type peptidyl-prolyl cis-trans isomerase FklB
MKVKIIGILVCFTLCAASAQGQKLKNESDSLSYALGILFGKNIQAGGFQNIDIDIFDQAIRKVLHNEAQDLTLEQANMFVNMQYMKLQQVRFEKNLAEGRAFLDNNKNAPGVVALPSGLQYKAISIGTGVKPTNTDKVTVHYHGTLLNGTVFDSSVQRNQPIELSVSGVIAGWTEALQLMPVGSKWILYIPPELAYGERQMQGSAIEPNSTLIFEVELISINN